MAAGRTYIERLRRMGRSARLCSLAEMVREKMLARRLADADAARRDADSGIELLDQERSRLTKLLCAFRLDAENFPDRLAEVEKVAAG